MPSQSRGTRHPITTHARKGAARKALECAHHTASPGAMRRKRRKASWVRFSGVGHAKRYNEMSLCSISLYRDAGQARCYASVAKRHIAYQQVFKIPSASASTRPHGLRKPAAR